MTVLIDEVRAAGIAMLLDGDSLKLIGERDAIDRFIPELKAHKSEIVAALKAEQIANRIEDFTELYEERAAIAEYDGGLSREQAEELAIRTAWRWVLSSGDGGTYRCTALTYEEAREHLEKQFLGRKVTNLEFISAMAEGHGFVPYQPEMGEIKQ